MKTAYKRLNQYDRFEIEKLVALGKNNIQIASTLSVHPSTVSRERNRLKKQPYNAIKALTDSVYKSLDKRLGKTKIDNNPKLKNFVYSHLKLHWSPQQISDALKQFYPFDSSMQISHESIYFHIYVQPKKEVKNYSFRNSDKREITEEMYVAEPIKGLQLKILFALMKDRKTCLQEKYPDTGKAT